MHTNRIVLGIALLVVSGMLLVGCTCPVTPPVEPTADMVVAEATPEPEATKEVAPTEVSETAAAPEASAVAEVPMATWQADGAISEGEYAHETAIGDVNVWWYNDAEFLFLAMEASTTGWVAVGIDPVNRMQGADFIFGAVVDGEAMIWDAFGTAPVGNAHPPDEELGGTNDIVAYAGVEDGGVTRFEVQIPLDSGDEFDKPLEPGRTYAVIVAVGTSDSFDARHSSRATGSITLD